MSARAEAARALAILFSAITGGRMALYEIAVLGDPSSEQLRDLERGLQEAADAFQLRFGVDLILQTNPAQFRSEEHTSELQSLMRISYAVFCLKKKKVQQEQTNKHVQ